MPPLPPQRRRRGVSCPSALTKLSEADNPKKVAEDDDDDDDESEPRRRNDEPESPEDEESEGDEPMDDVQRDASTEDQLVKKLVRYALACEYSRIPIRRDGIKDKGLLFRQLGFRNLADRLPRSAGAAR